MLETKLAQTLRSIHTLFAIEARRESPFAPSARSRQDAAVMILSTKATARGFAAIVALYTWTMDPSGVPFDLPAATYNGPPKPCIFPSLPNYNLTSTDKLASYFLIIFILHVRYAHSTRSS